MKKMIIALLKTGLALLGAPLHGPQYKPSGAPGAYEGAFNVLIDRRETKYPNVERFVNLYGPLFTAACSGTPIFPSVALGQCALETGWQGKRKKTMFGIKGEGNAGSQILTTKEYVNGKYITVKQKFAKYKTIQDEIDAYIKLICEKPWYKRALKAKTAYTQIEAIAKGEGDMKYATAPDYAKKVKSCMKLGKLDVFDGVVK